MLEFVVYVTNKIFYTQIVAYIEHNSFHRQSLTVSSPPFFQSRNPVFLSAQGLGYNAARTLGPDPRLNRYSDIRRICVVK